VTLHLIRHGVPDVDAAKSPGNWDLAASASADVHLLRASGILPPSPSTVWAASAERKALQTAQLLTSSDILIVDDLHETRRTWQPDPNAFQNTMESSFSSPFISAAPGWEPFASATQRLRRATIRIVERARSGDVVLVGHGTAWTLLASALTATTPTFELWQTMTQPDHCAIDIRNQAMISPWGAWRLQP
jgi:broad specificity phosphatase PhoE